jgi:hypothetical protein
MSILHFFRSREWVTIRRFVLIGLIVFLAYRTWGSSLLTPFQSANAARDLAITKSEFRPDVPGSKPAWIIGIRNNSSRFGYDLIEVEATYLNKSGAVLEKDTMTLHQKLVPGQEEVIGSTDYRERPGAMNGTLKVIKAVTLK